MARTLGGQRRKVIEIRRAATAGMQCCTLFPAVPEKTTTERCGRAIETGAVNSPGPTVAIPLPKRMFASEPSESAQNGRSKEGWSMCGGMQAFRLAALSVHGGER